MRKKKKMFRQDTGTYRNGQFVDHSTKNKDGFAWLADSQSILTSSNKVNDRKYLKKARRLYQFAGPVQYNYSGMGYSGQAPTQYLPELSGGKKFLAGWAGSAPLIGHGIFKKTKLGRDPRAQKPFGGGKVWGNVVQTVAGFFNLKKGDDAKDTKEQVVVNQDPSFKDPTFEDIPLSGDSQMFSPDTQLAQYGGRFNNMLQQGVNRYAVPQYYRLGGVMRYQSGGDTYSIEPGGMLSDNNGKYGFHDETHEFNPNIPMYRAKRSVGSSNLNFSNNSVNVTPPVINQPNTGIPDYYTSTNDNVPSTINVFSPKIDNSFPNQGYETRSNSSVKLVDDKAKDINDKSFYSQEGAAKAEEKREAQANIHKRLDKALPEIARKLNTQKFTNKNMNDVHTIMDEYFDESDVQGLQNMLDNDHLWNNLSFKEAVYQYTRKYLDDSDVTYVPLELNRKQRRMKRTRYREAKKESRKQRTKDVELYRYGGSLEYQMGGNMPVDVGEDVGKSQSTKGGRLKQISDTAVKADGQSHAGSNDGIDYKNIKIEDDELIIKIETPDGPQEVVLSDKLPVPKQIVDTIPKEFIPKSSTPRMMKQVTYNPSNYSFAAIGEMIAKRKGKLEKSINDMQEARSEDITQTTDIYLEEIQEYDSILTSLFENQEEVATEHGLRDENGLPKQGIEIQTEKDIEENRKSNTINDMKNSLYRGGSEIQTGGQPQQLAYGGMNNMEMLHRMKQQRMMKMAMGGKMGHGMMKPVTPMQPYHSYRLNNPMRPNRIQGTSTITNPMDSIYQYGGGYATSMRRRKMSSLSELLGSQDAQKQRVLYQMGGGDPNMMPPEAQMQQGSPVTPPGVEPAVQSVEGGQQDPMMMIQQLMQEAEQAGIPFEQYMQSQPPEIQQMVMEIMQQMQQQQAQQQQPDPNMMQQGSPDPMVQQQIMQTSQMQMGGRMFNNTIASYPRQGGNVFSTQNSYKNLFR